VIHQAIDEVCSSSVDGVSWRRARKKDVPAVRRLTASSLSEEQLVQDGFSDSPLYYSLVLEKEFGICGVAIVFVEFSTWEGRVLFLKRLVLPSDDQRVPTMRMLAKIALHLDCIRLVWQVRYFCWCL